MIDAMKVVDFKITVNLFFFQSLFTWGWKKISPVENVSMKKLSFNTNDGVLMLHYTSADYSTGI